jgi:predicted phage-related endonuclease
MNANPDVSQRRGFIGGADWENLLGEVMPEGERPYGCTRRVWYVKRGEAPDYPEEVTGPMSRGNRLEDVAVELYEQTSGRRTMRRDSFREVAMPAWWGGHVDRAIIDNGDGRGPGILEVKTVGEWIWRQIKRDGVPQRFPAQVQHYLGLSGYGWGTLFVYWPDGDRYLTVPVTRDETLLDLMREVGDRFMRMAEFGPAPHRLDTKDRRCQGCPFRHTCQGQAILDAAGESGDVQRLDDPALVKLLREEQEAAELSTEADAVLEVCREKVRQSIWHLTAVEVPGFRVYFRAQTSKKIDTRLLRAEQPEIAAKYERPIITRPLRIFAI